MWSEVVSGAIGGVVGGGFALSGQFLQARLSRKTEQRQRSYLSVESVQNQLAQMERTLDRIFEQEADDPYRVPVDEEAMDRWVAQHLSDLRRSVDVIAHTATRQAFHQVLLLLQAASTIGSLMDKDGDVVALNIVQAGQDIASRYLRDDPIESWSEVEQLRSYNQVYESKLRSGTAAAEGGRASASSAPMTATPPRTSVAQRQ